MKKPLLALTALLCAFALCLPAWALGEGRPVRGHIECALHADAFSALTGMEIDDAAALDTLLGQSSLQLGYSGDGFQLALSAGGQTALALSGDRDDAGGVTLASGLFPSYALSVPARMLDARQNTLLGDIVRYVTNVDDNIAYEEEAYSSLFHRAVYMELGSHTVAGWMRQMAQFPLANNLLARAMTNGMTPADYAAETLAATDKVWGVVAKYKADARQYPDLQLIRIELDIPALPHLYLWVRLDEFGASVRFAAESKKVSDWDETLVTLSEGGSDTGFLVDVFTLDFAGDDEVNTYIEAAVVLPGKRVVAEIDCYISRHDDYAWKASGLVREDTLGDVLSFNAQAFYGENGLTDGLADGASLSRLDLPLTQNALDNLLSDIRDIGLPALRAVLADAVPGAGELFK